jgi:hypothetical protein
MYHSIRGEEGEHKAFFPIYPRFRLGDHGFTVSLRIRLDVAVRVSQEREEIFVGSEGFDGLALQRVGAGKKRDEPERQWAR